jgi:hypothetical protein
MLCLGSNVMSSYFNVKRLAEMHTGTEQALQVLEKDWDPELPPITVAMTTVGRALAANAKTLSADELAAIFGFAEKLLTEGDKSTQEATATGFLEALLSEASAGRLDFSMIDPFLRPESRKYSLAWDDFTGVRTRGLRR